MSFARTKIQPPRPRSGSLIERRALERRLADALSGHRLVLVCAAAGYGKTAALARQIERLPAATALAWVAADEGDDLHRLLGCLLAALEPHDPPWRTSPEGVVSMATQGDRGLRQAAAAELLNALDACDVPHGVIVFDDLHRVDDPEWFEFLDLLLERLGPRWTLVIGSRSEPPLALARLRARGDLAEFRQADLCFDNDEVRVLATAAGLDTATADNLYRRTQGWAVGLRLALNALRGEPGAARQTTIDRHVFEFLATEVLDRLDPELREFLLRTAVLPELTARRAAAVSGNAHAARLLDEIERLGLFVSVLDATETPELTLRLHDLFRDALEHRLLSERPDELPALLMRAAVDEPDPTRRIGLLLRAGAPAEAAQVLLAHGPRWMSEGALASVNRQLAQFPAAWAERSAEWQRVRGLAAWARWDFTGMLDAMQRAEACYAATDDQAGRQAALAYQSLALNALGRLQDSGRHLGTLRREALSPEVRMVVLVACAWHALDVGSLHRVGPVLAELLDLLERHIRIEHWFQSMPVPRFNGLPGTAGPLQRYADGVLRFAGDTPTPLRAAALLQLGWRRLWQGRLADAERSVRDALADGQWVGDPVNVRNHAQLLSALLAALRGDREASLALARQRVQDHAPERGGWPLWETLFQAARVAVLCDDEPLLADCLERMAGLPCEADPGADARLRPREPLLAQLARLRGRPADACAGWQAALQHEEQIDELGQAAETRLHLAAALWSDRQPEAAAAVLQPVFERTVLEGEPGGVVLAATPLRLLAAADWGKTLDPEQQAQLLGWAMFTGLVEPAPPAGAGDEAGPEVMGLSPREREVLERIAAGDSNKLIARAFDLSPHTVKRHVANLLGKLGVDSRGQAAAWYLAQQR